MPARARIAGSAAKKSGNFASLKRSRPQLGSAMHARKRARAHRSSTTAATPNAGSPPEKGPIAASAIGMAVRYQRLARFDRRRGAAGLTNLQRFVLKYFTIRRSDRR
jgi:hypothetical protein